MTKESDHYEHLLDYVPVSGEGLIFVTLHIDTVGVRTKLEAIIVELDGAPIGELTKGSSEKFITAVKHLEGLGLTCGCMAKIKGSSVAAEVTLYAKKAHELTEEELNPTGFSSYPSSVPFEANPLEYDAPARYAGEPLPASSKKPETKTETDSPRTPTATPPTAWAAPAPLVETAPAVPSILDPIPWGELLVQDGTRRATPFQRGYVRGIANKYITDGKAPRIDYITVGQCEMVLRYLGESITPLTTQGRNSMTLWWVLVMAITLLVLLFSFIPTVGPLVFLASLGFLVFYFWTRSKLQPPFNKKR
ncbi:hypothetical protein [Corynebacterium silvaticum]|uniref:Uncharacterized protein n=1 Tax=Corynebacterium silvaticum TaxID=2320431 RepID=A0A7U5K9E8_9CORY|nr:hypothetical protein [Corynebacterium silvaticum]ARU46737.1 hypothetical protein CBE74_10060 [Corynebacterium silvaticum]UWG99976.1 hypothetical protein K1I39_09985 [Corynebacterium silvaticum]UWH02023.1 hypothetical protein K1I38_10010 [Corynebacterium silvaticum]UWH04058.1 hypothetical protein K1I36_10010 [Corynebacterium silvaticum]UXZ26223.1 hypothetical protein K3929_10015 [Corynebacterium silvaticum]